jgi:dTDP-4-dehydrorhamnose 3,5-epimerase
MHAERLLTADGREMHGPLLLTPQVFEDDRGYFLESWNQRTFAEILEADCQPVSGFVQDNHSRSVHGVMRGLHYQLPPRAQGKLVRCVLGEIFDVAVDFRLGSTTFGCWTSAWLDSVKHQQLWIPSGFAHGFLTLSDQAEVLYKATNFWSREYERNVRWDDPHIAIAWPLKMLEVSNPLISEKDAGAPLFSAVRCFNLFSA